MATKDLKARLKLKYDLYANWIANDPVLLAGEAAIAVIPAETGAVVQEPCILIKIGDGTKKFSQLPFVSGIAADVYTWAKAATKPSYTAEEISGLARYRTLIPPIRLKLILLIQESSNFTNMNCLKLLAHGLLLVSLSPFLLAPLSLALQTALLSSMV